jgi:hypothetical protein
VTSATPKVKVLARRAFLASLASPAKGTCYGVEEVSGTTGGSSFFSKAK